MLLLSYKSGQVYPFHSGIYICSKRGQSICQSFYQQPRRSDDSNKKTEIIQKNNYPWDGALSFIINPASASSFNLLLRIPGWARNEAIPSTLYQFENNSDAKPIIKVNGQSIDYTIEKGYVSIKRTWKKNDQVEMTLPMEIRKIVANPKIPDDIGKMALQRGPLIYCAEWVDNFGKTSNIILTRKYIFYERVSGQFIKWCSGIEVRSFGGYHKK